MVTDSRRNGVMVLTPSMALNWACRSRVDRAAVAGDDVVGAVELLDLADGEVLDARAGGGDEGHEEHADQQRVGRRRRALGVARRCCRPRAVPRARSATAPAAPAASRRMARNGPATITPTNSSSAPKPIAAHEPPASSPAAPNRQSAAGDDLAPARERGGVDGGVAQRLDRLGPRGAPRGDHRTETNVITVPMTMPWTTGAEPDLDAAARAARRRRP